jgi:hypothetical protein
MIASEKKPESAFFILMGAPEGRMTFKKSRGKSAGRDGDSPNTKDARNLFFFSGNDRFHRTLIAAGAAVRAQLRINHILVFAFGYRSHRTFILA